MESKIDERLAALSDKEHKEIRKLAETKVKGRPRNVPHSSNVLELVKESKETIIPSYPAIF